MRGIKDSNAHALSTGIRGRRDGLTKVLGLVDASRGGTWYIDVGLEFIIQGEALLWSTHAHSRILAEAVSINREEADSIISNVWKYSKDINTHLTTLSGFRASVEDVGPISVAYVQVYTTDKTQTYNPEGRRYGKTLTPRVAMDGNPPRWCQSLQNLYHDAALNTDVAGRIEVRCPLEFAEDCLLYISDDLIRTSLICYRRDIWW
jgi:hypothetical protein